MHLSHPTSHLLQHYSGPPLCALGGDRARFVILFSLQHDIVIRDGCWQLTAERKDDKIMKHMFPLLRCLKLQQCTQLNKIMFVTIRA